MSLFYVSALVKITFSVQGGDLSLLVEVVEWAQEMVPEHLPWALTERH